MLNTYQKNILSNPELTENERRICSMYLNNFVDEINEIKEVLDMIKDKKFVTFDLSKTLSIKNERMKEFEKKIEDMESGGNTDRQAAMQAVQQLASRQRLAQRRLDTKLEQLKRKRDAEIEQVERSLEATIRREQDWQKWLAVMLPPIPPLVVAFFVFFRRRAQEREGVAKARLR